VCVCVCEIVRFIFNELHICICIYFDSFEVSKSFFKDKKMSRISIPIVGFLLLCCLATMIQAEGEYIKYKDPKKQTNVRIEDLMSRMALAEKIGQMTHIEGFVATADVSRDYSIGSAPHFNAKAQDWIHMINMVPKCFTL